MTQQPQDSYIGNTTASQAVKAGSTPVSCSMKKSTPYGVLFSWMWGGRRRTILMEQSGGLFPAGQGPGRSLRGEAEAIDSRILLHKKGHP